MGILRVIDIGDTQVQAWFQYDSNLIPNMSPVLQELFLIVLIMQLFETTYWLLKSK